MGLERWFFGWIVVGLVLCTTGASVMSAGELQPAWMEGAIRDLKRELTPDLESVAAERLDRGLEQVSRFWREGDGDREAFEEFVRENFARDEDNLDALFARFESSLEKLDGHMNEITLEFKKHVDLDLGPILPVDMLFASYNPASHVLDDFFENRIAFVVLLNFPLATLEEKLSEGRKWSRRHWAEVRLAERFSKRIPAEVNQELAKAASDADHYVAGYNIWMHHLLDEKGDRLFPPGMRLLSHWNLRDEIKARYSEGSAGLPKQRMIQRVMERIVDQSIPAIVIDNPGIDWDPYTNEVRTTTVHDAEEFEKSSADISPAREPDARYRIVLETFHAARKVDPYSPTAPTLIARRFEEDREIPEEKVKAMFEEILTSPLVGRVAAMIEKRLGRKLEPFDIWYNGFRAGSSLDEEKLDGIVREKYPTEEAYRRDIPNLLGKLGFSGQQARYIASLIEVDPARGSGHAWGPEMRGESARLRTRVGKNGMDYKGFNIAVHEMGHNVEQVLSVNKIDCTLLRGVPNTAFTEAIAFVFQKQDLRLLGLVEEPDEREAAMGTLDDFWGTYEIAGVALVDMAIWHWMYDHPDADPGELRQATLEIARSVWNRYYAQHFGKKDVTLLAIYSHILHSFLYIPDYPLGQIIATQIERHLEETGGGGEEIERMVTTGSIAPDLWMEEATGSPVSPRALLEGAERALDLLEGGM